MANLMTDRFEMYKTEGTEISVFLANGIKLNGHVVDFDNEALILTSDAGPEGVTIVRSSIATMMRRSTHSHSEERTHTPGAPRRASRT